MLRFIRRTAHPTARTPNEFEDPERWNDTRFLDRALWDRLIAARGQNVDAVTRDPRLVHMMRFSPGGTAVRYAVSLSESLRNGGGESVSDFYERHGRNQREA